MMRKNYTNHQFVPAGWPVPSSVPPNAAITERGRMGVVYGWDVPPAAPPTAEELQKIKDDTNEAIRRINNLPVVIGNVDGASRPIPPLVAAGGWSAPADRVAGPFAEPEPEPDFFPDYIRATIEARRKNIEQFLISTFDITEEEQQSVREVLAKRNISTIRTSAGRFGKTRRAWAWERLMKRLHEDPLPAKFWTNVYGYDMLDDALGRDLIHTLTRGRS